MTKQFDTELHFDAFVKSYGGVVIKKSLSSSPRFDNADYFFPAHRIVAELKCLEEDKLDDPDFIAKIDACWAKWHHNGKLPSAIPNEIRSDQIPPECFTELRKIYLSPLRGVIKKANKQIRETKAEMHLEDCKGLLLLANDGNFALPPKTLITCIFEILNGDYSQINDFVIFTTNILAKVPGSDIPSYLWLSGFFNEKTAIPKAVIEDIANRWKAYHESIAGESFRPLGSSETQRIPI